MANKNNGKRIIVWFAVLLSLALVALIQKQFDLSQTVYVKQKQKAVMAISEPLIPSTKALEIISLGHPQVVADILWLQMIQYFGGGNSNGKYRGLAPMVERITSLDPKFEYPYQFGMVVLPFMDGIDSAIRIGEQAMKVFPNNGLLAYYHASNYHLYKKDYKQASYWYDKASTLPGAPGAAKQLAAVTKSKINDNLVDRQAAIYYWQVAAEQAKNADDKALYLKWADQMYIVYVLESSAQAYKDKTGSYPVDLNTLITAGYIKSIPDSPVGRIWDYDNKTGKISFENVKE